MTDKDVQATEEAVAVAAEAAVTEAVNEAVEQNPEAQSLTVQDLQAIAKVIDLASRRGAFQASEMAAVGASFNKLIGFLSHVVAQQEAAQKQEEEGKATSAPDTSAE